jgi:hypothetical protein
LFRSKATDQLALPLHLAKEGLNFLYLFQYPESILSPLEKKDTSSLTATQICKVTSLKTNAKGFDTTSAEGAAGSGQCWPDFGPFILIGQTKF